MPSPSACFAFLVPLLFSAASAGASLKSLRVKGEVVSTASRWAGETGGPLSLIVTESTIRTQDGRHVQVVQPGGSVNGVGMHRFHTAPLLQAGDYVIAELDGSSIKAQGGRYQLRSLLELTPAPASEGDNQKTADRFAVRTHNSSGVPIYWKSNCAFLQVDSEGTSHLASDLELAIVNEVLQSWVSGTQSCSSFRFEQDPAEPSEVGLDGINLIKFRDQRWCRPARGDAPEQCYDDAAAGLTTLFYVDDADSKRNGEIIDADIELNGVNFAISDEDQSLGDAACKADLRNTLTHEVGHFVGLDHTCQTNGTSILDVEGNMVPSCTGPRLPESVREATMYNFQSCGETKKGSIEDDDVAGWCAIYPQGAATSSCERASIEDGGCCSVAGGQSKTPTIPLALLLFGSIVLVLRPWGARAAS